MDCRFYLLHLNKLAIFDNNFYECLIYITVGVKLGLTGNTRIINVVKCVFYFSDSVVPASSIAVSSIPTESYA